MCRVTGGNVDLNVVGAKIDEMLQLLKTNKVQQHTSSQGQSGKDTAVAATHHVMYCTQRFAIPFWLACTFDVLRFTCLDVLQSFCASNK